MGSEHGPIDCGRERSRSSAVGLGPAKTCRVGPALVVTGRRVTGFTSWQWPGHPLPPSPPAHHRPSRRRLSTCHAPLADDSLAHDGARTRSAPRSDQARLPHPAVLECPPSSPPRPRAPLHGLWQGAVSRPRGREWGQAVDVVRDAGPGYLHPREWGTGRARWGSWYEGVEPPRAQFQVGVQNVCCYRAR